MVRRTPTSPLGFQVLYVFLVFDHARREVRHFAVTSHPSMEWVIQQLREATPFGKQPQYVFRDNDGIYGYGVRAFWTPVASRRCAPPMSRRGRTPTSSGSSERFGENCWTM